VNKLGHFFKSPIFSRPFNILGLVGRVLAPSVEGASFESPVWSSQRLKNWHLLLPWLAHHVRPRAELVASLSVYIDWVGYSSDLNKKIIDTSVKLGSKSSLIQFSSF